MSVTDTMPPFPILSRYTFVHETHPELRMKVASTFSTSISSFVAPVKRSLFASLDFSSSFVLPPSLPPPSQCTVHSSPKIDRTGYTQTHRHPAWAQTRTYILWHGHSHALKNASQQCSLWPPHGSIQFSCWLHLLTKSLVCFPPFFHLCIDVMCRHSVMRGELLPANGAFIRAEGGLEREPSP